MKTVVRILEIILVLVVVKIVWVNVSIRGIGDWESEKGDILGRRSFLVEKVVSSPKEVIDQTPSAIGEQFQGEWALYTCSMLSASLVNTAILYPETKEESLDAIDSLIGIVLDPLMRKYDTLRWGEDPLESLSGDNSHVSYLSHLAWMIAGYKTLGGDNRYNDLQYHLCATLNRRILSSPLLNLETYPGELIYVPDMLVAIVALSLYADQHSGQYRTTVDKWLSDIKANWLSNETGLISSFIPQDDVWKGRLAVKGSYTALSCYYLTFVDEEFAHEQYDLFKEHYGKKFPVTGFKEYVNRSPMLGMDIDSGPVIFGLSPTGTAFGIGASTFFGDNDFRSRLLHTAEVAGTTIYCRGRRHYLLADIALVGEAITLAMRTAVPW